MHAPSSRIPPQRAAAVAGDLYNPCACLHEYHYIFCRCRQPVPPNKELIRIKNIFATNISSRGKIDIEAIFANSIYSRLIGQFDEVNEKFEGHLKDIVEEMERSFRFAA